MGKNNGKRRFFINKLIFHVILYSMVCDGKIWLADVQGGRDAVFLEPKMANRHGLISGATGTGKTVTLKVLAESFSDMGVPVFLADVKGDLAGMLHPGTGSADMQRRRERFGLDGAGFAFSGYPVTFWDLYGKRGIPLRTTVSEMGPLLLSNLLGLNDLQRDIMTIAFKIADDNSLLLVDTKDLKAVLSYIGEHSKDFTADYGNISPATIAAIMRAVVSLEIAGGSTFFGETALNIGDWFSTPGSGGRGMLHVLDSCSLISNGRLYSTFLLWMLSELFEVLPEVGDLEKPKMVFFFDEAHLLFRGAPKVLLEKIEQVVRLIRSKGVGVWFCTQSPRDIPDEVLAQLGNKVVHSLHAYTPADQKAVKAVAASFRVNPAFDAADALLSLGTGEALVSFLDEKGVPAVVQRAEILPPQSKFGGIGDAERLAAVQASPLYERYSKAFDPESAYEFLQRRGVQGAAPAAAAKQDAGAKKAGRQSDSAARQCRKAVQRAGSSAAGTLGRQLGRELCKGLGSTGKAVGGSLGASLGRGLLDTLFKL